MAAHAADPPTTAAAPDGPVFESALRGYDRRQVDDHVAAQAELLARARADLTAAHQQRKAAVERAAATEAELRALRAHSAQQEQSSATEGFGFRAEKLLRLAEQETQEIRTHAARESAAVVEKARTEAEQHRHGIEQSLIARAAKLEQEAAQRMSELQDREQQINDQLVAAKDQAEQLYENASRRAERLRQESEAAAEQTRVRAETAAQRQLDQATHEIARLAGLQADVRAELARLAAQISAELTENDVPEQRTGSPAEPAEPALNGRSGPRVKGS